MNDPYRDLMEEMGVRYGKTAAELVMRADYEKRMAVSRAETADATVKKLKMENAELRNEIKKLKEEIESIYQDLAGPDI